MNRTVLASLLFLAACRGDSNSGDDGPDGGNTDDVSVFDIQGSMPVDGTAFNVRGVIVTVIDTYGERKGNIVVQEPAGGAFSGVLVFGLDLGDVSDLEVGDVVDLVGVTKDEFALSDDTSGRTTTELTPPEGGAITVTVVDHVDVPEPEVIDALAIGQMTDADARDDEWEQWEGVLIRLESVTALSTLDQIGSTPQDPPFEDFKVTGPLYADTSLTSIDAITFDECLESITGVGDYFFNYKILPRSTADIVHGGSGCPAAENLVDSCGDEFDNDANGFVDCDDNGCGAIAACSTDTTVSAIQMGTIAAGENATLTNVVVTAIDNAGPYYGFWAADAAQAAAYQGVFVFTDGALPAGITVGQLATFTGEVDEFDLPCPSCTPAQPTAQGDTITQVETTATAVTLTAGSTPLALGGIVPDDLKNITTGEQYEGVLVTLSNMKVTASASGFRYTLTATSGQTIVIDDDVYASFTGATITANTTCYETITGVMSLNIFDDERRLYPRNLADLDDTGGTCL